MTWPQAARVLAVSMPLRLLKSSAPGVESRVAKRIPRDNQALRLLTGYLGAWQQGELAGTPEMQQVLANHMHDLFALVAGASGDAAEMAAGRGGRAARLAMIRREIRHGALDPGFSLPTLAQRVGVSSRYVQMLLEEEGSSFVRKVTEQRLKRARNLLQSPRHRHLSIIEIALECGFATMAHFHRLFHHRYHATPGDLRRDGGAGNGGADLKLAPSPVLLSPSSSLSPRL